jgi:hypothetical protein
VPISLYAIRFSSFVFCPVGLDFARRSFSASLLLYSARVKIPLLFFENSRSIVDARQSFRQVLIGGEVALTFILRSDRTEGHLEKSAGAYALNLTV